MKSRRTLLAALLLMLCFPAGGVAGSAQRGVASWYSHKPGTCAHRTLPMGTIVRVTHTRTGRSTTCRVADRGPFVKGRIIDLDRRVFAELAPLSDGVFSAEISW